MISTIRNSIFTKCLWSFIALYIFNCSVDAPDFYSESHPENLSFNEQESIIEFFVEKILGFEYAIAEYDDNDETQESALKKSTSFDFFVFNEHPYDEPKYLNIYKKERYSRYHHAVSSSFIEIQSPPPEV